MNPNWPNTTDLGTLYHRSLHLQWVTSKFQIILKFWAKLIPLSLSQWNWGYQYYIIESNAVNRQGYLMMRSGYSRNTMFEVPRTRAKVPMIWSGYFHNLILEYIRTRLKVLINVWRLGKFSSSQALEKSYKIVQKLILFPGLPVYFGNIWELGVPIVVHIASIDININLFHINKQQNQIRCQ